PPLEVDAPRLRVFRLELHRPERNANLGIPAVVTNPRRDVPDAVPARVGFAALVGHLSVPLRPAGIDREHVSVPEIAEAVDDEDEGVASSGVEILFQFADDDLPRRVVAGK